MSNKKIESKLSSRKIVNRVFALVCIFAVIGTIFFSIMTVLTNVRLNKTDYSSYLSFEDYLSTNEVFGSSTQYKVSHTLYIHNHTTEKLTVDLVLTYINSDNSIFVKSKSVILQADTVQNIYFYYYHSDSAVALKSIGFRLDNKTSFGVLYDTETYERLYEGYNIITFGHVRQYILLMAMCILVLVISVILYLITLSMYNNAPKKKRKRKVKTNESNRSE